MSAEFARALIVRLNKRIHYNTSIHNLDVAAALREYRDSITAVMTEMGHKI